MVSERIKLLFDADTSQAETKLEKLHTATKTAMFAGATVWAKKSIEDVSTLTEATNLMKKTMGKSDGSSFIKDVKEHSAEAGMSMGEMAGYASQYSATLDGIGFKHKDNAKLVKELVQRQADAGSFYDKDNSEMAMKISMAIRGSVEATEGLGKAMTQTNLEAYATKELHKKSYKHLSEQEKTMVRIKFFMQQTKTASGDFKDSLSGSFPNQVKELEGNFVNMGDKLAEKVLPSIIKIMEWVNNNMGAVQKIAKYFIAWKISKGLFGGLKRVSRSLKGIKRDLATTTAMESAKGLAKSGVAGKSGKGFVGGLLSRGKKFIKHGASELLGLGLMADDLVTDGAVQGWVGDKANKGFNFVTHNVLHLDGEKVAKNTSKHAQKRQTNSRVVQ